MLLVLWRGAMRSVYAAGCLTNAPHCTRSKDCEALAADLAAAGIRARHYHADMEPGPREAAHTAWSAGRVQVRGCIAHTAHTHTNTHTQVFSMCSLTHTYTHI